MNSRISPKGKLRSKIQAFIVENSQNFTFEANTASSQAKYL